MVRQLNGDQRLALETRACSKVQTHRKTRGPNFVSRAQVYRHFDFAGNLLYIGVSLSALTRLQGHKRESSWFEQIAFVTVEHYGSREEAEAAEARAIRSEQPTHNRKHVSIPIAEFIGPDDPRPLPGETWENDRPRDRKSPRQR